jgi:hypothetical protein
MAVAAVTGSFTATGNGNTFLPNTGRVNVNSGFNVAVYGTFVGTVVLERSFDNGVNYVPVLRNGTAISYTTPSSETIYDPEGDVLYRFRCSAYTSGTANYRLSN